MILQILTTVPFKAIYVDQTSKITEQQFQPYSTDLHDLLSTSRHEINKSLNVYDLSDEEHFILYKKKKALKDLKLKYNHGANRSIFNQKKVMNQGKKSMSIYRLNDLDNSDYPYTAFLYKNELSRITNFMDRENGFCIKVIKHLKSCIIELKDQLKIIKEREIKLSIISKAELAKTRKAIDNARKKGAFISIRCMSSILDREIDTYNAFIYDVSKITEAYHNIHPTKSCTQEQLNNIVDLNAQLQTNLAKNDMLTIKTIEAW